MVDFAKQLKKARLDLNPSSADRWTTCTASPKFILDNWAKLPPSDTVFNQEGTTAHEVASAFLQDRQPRVKDSYFCPVPVDKEMRMHGWNYAEYVLGLQNQSGELLVEQKLPLWYMPERNAIVDAAVINHDSLHIVDYKYGAGVVVSPIDSLQATIYAQSIIYAHKLKLPDDFPVTIHIYQPRGRASVESPSHTWETTSYGIRSLADFVARSAVNVLIGDPEELVFKPSEKACQWCPAKGFCTARQKWLTGEVEALAVIDNKTPNLPSANTISVDQLSAIVKHKDQLVKWLNDAEAYALQFMKGGGKIPGHKLVLSRGGNRYWSDPKAAEKLLLKTILKREEVIEEKIIGPAAAEKLLGKDKFNVALANLVAKPPGQPVIAPMDDKREECLVDGKTEFTTLEEY